MTYFLFHVLRKICHILSRLARNWRHGPPTEAMSVALRAVELLTFVGYALDPLYRPGRYLRSGGSPWMEEPVLGRRLCTLRSDGLVERRRDASGWVYSLTESGRRLLTGAHDPETRWKRSWDGHWRQIIFDLPARQRALRAELLRWLRAQHFGYLQDSLWITPDPVRLSLPALEKMGASADMAVFLESRTIGSSSDAAIVKAGWNFPAIFAAHHAHHDFVEAALARQRQTLAPREAVALIRKERAAWRSVLELDPLLPKVLWPKAYPGEATLAGRERFFGELRERLTRSAPAA